MSVKRRLLLIDATAFCYRAFYAIRNLASSSGQPTNAVFGFVRMLQKVLKDYQPEYLGVCFDVSAKTFRHEKFAAYKAQRQAMPDSLGSQLPLIKEIVRAYGITICEQPGFEADDVIATLSRQAKNEHLGVTVVSSDKDMLQLVDEQVELINPLEKEGPYTQEKVRDKMGVDPAQVADLIALTGDTADNIPAIKGVSAKRAIELVRSWGSVEEILAHRDELAPEKVRSAVLEQAEQLRLNKELAALQSDVKLQISRQDLLIKPADYPRLAELFRELELKAFLKELPESARALEEPAAAGPAVIMLADNEIPAALASFGKPKEICVYLSAAGADTLAFGLPGQDRIYSCNTQAKDLRSLLADASILKVVHDLKQLVACVYPAVVNGPFFDIMLAAYLVNPGRSSYKLNDLAWEFLKRTVSDDIPAGTACQLIAGLRPLLQAELEKAGLQKVFTGVEMPLACVLAGMERTGIRLDTAMLKKLSGEVEQQLAVLIQEIYGLCGCQFNINSPKQLSEVLFVKLQLPVVKKTKTGASTDEEVLRTLAPKHELPAKLLDYRQLTKLKSTYIDALPQLVEPSSGRLHSTFNQTGTETGRLSSSNPNLQNLPIRTELGRAIRRAVIAFGPDSALLSCDYSQIELRILAHLSGDEELIAAFKTGEDIHRKTAALIHGIDEKEVTDAMRSMAKRVNFGIVYGLSAYGLARDLGIAQEAAQHFIDAYFLRYPGVKDYINRQISQAMEKGFVTTMLGRRRYVPEINDRNQAVRQFAQRQAVNTPIQGSASDMIKLAMVEIDRVIRSKKLDARMIIQIHDELLFDLPRKGLKASAELIRSCMQDCMPLAVPVVVDCSSGLNWSDMEKI